MATEGRAQDGLQLPSQPGELLCLLTETKERLPLRRGSRRGLFQPGAWRGSGGSSAHQELGWAGSMRGCWKGQQSALLPLQTVQPSQGSVPLICLNGTTFSSIKIRA